MRPSDLHVSRAVSRTGIVLDGQTGRGQLGFMVAREDLVAAGWLGEYWFHTERDRAHIVLRADMPKTLIAAAVGRSIGEIVAHPIFEGRDYLIVRTVRVEDGPAVAFTFHTGKVVFELPCPHEAGHSMPARMTSSCGRMVRAAMGHLRGRLTDADGMRAGAHNPD